MRFGVCMASKSSACDLTPIASRSSQIGRGTYGTVYAARRRSCSAQARMGTSSCVGGAGNEPVVNDELVAIKRIPVADQSISAATLSDGVASTSKEEVSPEGFVSEGEGIWGSTLGSVMPRPEDKFGHKFGTASARSLEKTRRGHNEDQALQYKRAASDGADPKPEPLMLRTIAAPTDQTRRLVADGRADESERVSESALCEQSLREFASLRASSSSPFVLGYLGTVDGRKLE